MRVDGHPLTLLGMTTRRLCRRPMRSALTALGVAIGVVAIVSLSTIVRGLWRTTDQAIHFGDADMFVFQAGAAADLLSTLEEDETRARLLSTPGVSRAVGSLWHILPVEDRPFLLVLGLQVEDVAAFGAELVSGHYPQAEDDVMLGTMASRLLGKRAGDAVTMQGRTYRVAGVFETSVVFYNGAIILPLPTLQRLAGKPGCVTLFQTYCEEDANVSAIADRVESDHPDLVAVASVSEYTKVDQGLEIANGMVWTVTFIAVVIGSIIVANTMWMSVLERTREIGILRAVGWSRRRIVFMIVLEAAGLGLGACVIGSALGMVLAWSTKWLPVSSLFMEPAYDAATLLLALGVALLLSMLGAVMPAWRAARILPAEALRYE
ncbi:MAG: ABC transporter permease [Phycisphaerales bacterium]|nr:MAG: ABC transporter permease [Phycisphaerales bacterium]